MAQSGQRNDPLPAFRFTITLDDLPPAGFSECTGLQLETEVQDYREGGLNTIMRKFPGATKQSNIVLKRGIVDRRLWDWYFDLTQGKVKFRDGTIEVCGPAGGDPLAVWEFKRAFPTKLTGPDLNAGQNNTAVETLELCHEGLKRLK